VNEEEETDRHRASLSSRTPVSATIVSTAGQRTDIYPGDRTFTGMRASTSAEVDDRDNKRRLARNHAAEVTRWAAHLGRRYALMSGALVYPGANRSCSTQRYGRARGPRRGPYTRYRMSDKLGSIRPERQ
jgi:hypothetical protein